MMQVSLQDAPDTRPGSFLHDPSNTATSAVRPVARSSRHNVLRLTDIQMGNVSLAVVDSAVSRPLQDGRTLASPRSHGVPATPEASSSQPGSSSEPVSSVTEPPPAPEREVPKLPSNMETDDDLDAPPPPPFEDDFSQRASATLQDD